MFALINLLPRARPAGNLLPQNRWLPLGVFGLWLAGSATHVFCLSYVYNFDWEYVFILPLLWVVVWSAYLRQGELITRPAPMLAKILLAPPLAVALLALPAANHAVFPALTILNIGCYLALFLKDRKNITALHLSLLSGATLVAGLAKPIEFTPSSGIYSVNPGKWLLICGTLYGLYWIVRSRNPKAGVWGALVVAIAFFGLTPDDGFGLELAVQCGLVFLLLHSWRWVDAEHQGASAARILASVIWVFHALAMVHWQWFGAKDIALCAGGLLLGAAIVARLLTGGWRPAVVPIAATLVLLMPPGEFAAAKLQATPAGLLAVAGSFVLFGVGTLVAMTKPRWNAPVATAPVPVRNEPTP